MNTVDDVLNLAPAEFDTNWQQIDSIVSWLPLAEQVEAWQRVAAKLEPTIVSKGHPYFRLGVLHLLEDPDEAVAIDSFEKAYEEDKRFEDQTGKLAHRKAAYRVLALVKGFLRHLRGLTAENHWQVEQLNAPHRAVLVQTLLGLYDGTIPHVLDMKGYTYQEFFKLIDDRGLSHFAIENYFCATNLLELFYLEGQHIDRINDEYPLARAIVGLLGGVLEAILADRLPVRRKPLGVAINAGHNAGLIRAGSRLAALCSLILYLRNHVHADKAASQTEFYIDMNVAKGCKFATDWAISELLQEKG